MIPIDFCADDLAGLRATPVPGKLPALGVGVMYNPALSDFVFTDSGEYDYLEITSDMFWTDHGRQRHRRFEDLEPWVDLLDRVAAKKTVVAHNVGLSIGSAARFDEEYVEHLAQWQRRYRFPWHSDHLSYVQVAGDDGRDRNAGIAVPLPNDLEILEMVAERVMRVQDTVPAPFLLENGVYYVDYPGQDMSEPEFLNALTERTGCGLLLDLHNLYANSRNHDFDAIGYLEQLDLGRVTELHIAGGNEFAGMYTDAHAGPCPEPVWSLLEYTVALARNLRGVTFEFHDSYFHTLGEAGVREQLRRARDVWARHG
jgi:uncharacterized protein (UPF0276 family)